jgi:hypothetical protein
MLSDKVPVLLLALATPACATVPVGCPASIMIAGAWHAFYDAQLFQGPPSLKVELAPVNGKWDDLDAIKGTGNGKPFNLVCHYSGTAIPQTVSLSGVVKECDMNKPGSRFGAICQ